ncbi:CMRF35-like molecule 6, partial [Electrophorus electricus]|uniref:CMRF35-like molecule 6 n=1 Tax=Electrophorus electricus TaxID=8005 RepID=UPI0015D010EE
YDREKQNLTVTIRYVTVQDSGEYWCGTTSNWTTDRGFKIYSTQIYLRVIESPVSASSPHSSSHISPQFTKPTTSSGASSPDTGFPYSTVISVACVSLVLLLMGTSFLIVTLRKRSRKEQASSKGQSVQDSSHSHGVSHDCITHLWDES